MVFSLSLQNSIKLSAGKNGKKLQFADSVLQNFPKSISKSEVVKHVDYLRVDVMLRNVSCLQ